MDLFEHAQKNDPTGRPLAELVRPNTLDAFFGQDNIVGQGKLLREAIERDRVGSLILWGPPGSGKTTLARIVAARTDRHFEPFSAVLGGVKEIRGLVAAARDRRRMYNRRTILFIDEIHRFNKSQQDALLPHVEDGTITLIGATTENPSFELNAALLSRARVAVLQPIPPPALRALLQRAIEHPARIKRWPEIDVEPETLDYLADVADGDARRALGALEAALDRANPGSTINPQAAADALDRKILTYDKAGDGHYGVISAFIKSMRGSDPDAAVYWLQRMVEAGEDPLFILRRMVIFASEDVGLADPQALPMVTAAVAAFRFVGLPEGMYTLIHAATYLACSPKSNTVLKTLAAARKAVKNHGNLPIPAHLKPASNAFQKAQGNGRDYRYPHHFEGHYVAQDHLPAQLAGHRLFEPTDSGAEAEIKAHLAALRDQT